MALRTALTAAVGGALLLGQATTARADMMSACAPELARFCADVEKGRGRLLACLTSRAGELGPGCRAELGAAARTPAMPRIARRVLSPGFRADLPASCAAAAARYCPSLPPGGGGVFACLYARSDRVDATCSAAARAAVGR